MAEITVFYDGPVVTLHEARTCGLTRYFTGVPCRYGHVAQRLVSNASCALCLARKRKIREDAKTAARRARARERIIGCYYHGPPISREVALSQRLVHYFTGKPCKHGHIAQRYVTDTHCVICKAALHAEFLRRNPDFQSFNSRRWKKNNLEKARESDRTHASRRRSRKRGSSGNYTTAEIETLFHKQKGRCANCGKKLSRKYERDHIFALVNGGSNHISNIQLLCKTCNRRKHAKDPFDFARENGRLL